MGTGLRAATPFQGVEPIKPYPVQNVGRWCLFRHPTLNCGDWPSSRYTLSRCRANQTQNRVQNAEASRLFRRPTLNCGDWPSSRYTLSRCRAKYLLSLNVWRWICLFRHPTLNCGDWPSSRYTLSRCRANQTHNPVQNAEASRLFRRPTLNCGDWPSSRYTFQSVEPTIPG